MSVKIFFLVTFFVLSLELFPFEAGAACTCTCVGEEFKAVCDNSLEIQPICPPRVCTIAPPSIVPITPPTVPPVGTQQCRQEQVLNPSTGRYEWQRVCQ